MSDGFDPRDYDVALHYDGVEVWPKTKGAIGSLYTPDCIGFYYWKSVWQERQDSNKAAA